MDFMRCFGTTSEGAVEKRCIPKNTADLVPIFVFVVMFWSVVWGK